MRDEELPLIRAYYELLLWLIPAISKYPREHRFTLGERTEQRLISVLELMLQAKYSRQKVAFLEQVNLDLEVLRFLLRLAKDLKCLSLKSYGRSATALVDIGRQVGGWLKQCRE